jgi:hypothetical protein
MARIASTLLLTAFALGCTIEPKSDKPSASPGGAKAAEPVTPAPPVVVPCVLETTQPGPMRRSGRARIKLAGSALAVDTDVPALCGPLFNRDVDALAVKAGEGLLYEACVPEGYVQLTSRSRTRGAQLLHKGGSEAGAMDVSFNRVGGATYSSHGQPGDRVTLSDDFWKAEAELVLRDVDESGELRASIAFDCSAAPAEPATAAPAAPTGTNAAPNTQR